MNWMKLAQDKEKWCTLVNTVMKLWVSWKAGDASRNWAIVNLSRRG
jgi:hypothetical protein